MNENSFYSVDRLIEFGMGMSVAQQMVKQMNAAMQNMFVPGSIQTMPQLAPAPQPVQNIYYVAIDGQQVGPLNDAELMNLIQQQKVNKDTLGWMPGMPAWQAIEQIPAMLKVVALMPPALPL